MPQRERRCGQTRRAGPDEKGPHGGAKDGVEYVEAKPKTPETGFERVRIGLAGNAPRTMELRDTFGNVTTLRFGTFERNVAQDANAFRFTPPAGADVVGDAK